ncbi:MAG TPA: endolytic transglycosylase MltG [Amycolatopsis sp.]
MTEPRGPEEERGRRRLRGTEPPAGDAPRRARRTPPRPSGSHELPPPPARPRRGQPAEPYDAAPPAARPPRRRREEADELPPQPSQPPPGRRRRREEPALPPADAAPAPGRRRREDAELPDVPPSPGRRRRSDAADLPPSDAPGRRRADAPDLPPPDGPAPVGRRRADADVPPAPGRRRRDELPQPSGDPLADAPSPRRRRRADTGDVPLPGEAPPAGRRRRADAGDPPPGDPRLAAGPPPRRRDPGDPSMPPDPRLRRDPGEPSMPPDQRFAGPVDGSMPPDPRLNRGGDPSMPPDPRFAGPVDGSMPPDPRFTPPRRRRPEPPRPVENPTDVIPAVSEPEPVPAEHGTQIDGLFGDDEEYEGEYDDYEDYEDEYEEDEESYEEPAEEKPGRGKKAKAKRKGRKRKRALGWVAALTVLVLLAGGAWFGYQKIFGYADYDGSGEGSTLVQIDDGDTTTAIGTKLTDAGVVASAKAFVKAGADNTALNRIQHGYYVLKQHMSGASAVELITAPSSQVGRLEIRPYTQFDDIKQPGGKVTPGVFSLMSKASCADLNGKNTCISVDELRKTVANGDLKAFGVPDWALEPADKALSKDKRLEGLIAAGVYDVKPGWTATELITNLVHQSADALQAAGLTAQKAGPGMTPYQTLIIASLVEREAVKSDFGKISRVIYNRLAQKARLQLDSTVNYPLDQPTLKTSDEDRNRPGPYNTYTMTGLTPTPIAVPSTDAIAVALNPPPGDWMYFVKCEANGQSCFAVTYADHQKNVHEAQAKGVF